MVRGRRPTVASATRGLDVARQCALRLVVAGALACSGKGPAGTSPPAVDSIANPSFRADIQALLTRSCALGSGCHSAPGQCGLVLESGASYANLVNVQSVCAASFLRVKPNRPDSSLVARVIDAATANVSRMPFSGDTLPTAERGTIRSWIRNGAPNN